MQLRKCSKTKKLVIYGDSSFAEVAYESFTHDSEYEVVGFAVERAYLTITSLFGLPVVAIEDIEAQFPPATHEVYAAIVHTGLNRVRTRLMGLAEQKGYALASYISSQAFVWSNVQLGKHCFILEHCVLQPFVTIGDNAVLWSGTHIGHHSVLRDHVFAARVVIAGGCNIGQYCFLGASTTVANDVTIGDDCFINMCAAVTKDLESNGMYRGQPAKVYQNDARAFFKL
jgi:sugar O-acyltransferase (sialic acid O-acetyltransferase NeuD family)